MADNILYYGDNLDILRHHIPAASVDLIYLDPPFNSNADYNVIFREQSGQRSAAQIKAFTDTWHWVSDDGERPTARALEEVLTTAPERVAKMLDALVSSLGRNDLTAYLVMMTQRLVELHRVLKPTGSLYLHCDPTASHYLKIVLDSIFGPTNFRNEIVWKRTSAHNDPRRWGGVHDTLLFYSKSDIYTWNATFQPYEQSYLDSKYRYSDQRGTFRLSDLTAPGVPQQGDSSRPWRGFDPAKLGRHWAVAKGILESLIDPQTAAGLTTQQKLDVLDQHGYIYWTPRGRGDADTGFPQYKRYLGGGTPIRDVVVDIDPINSQARERLGYPTQKPLALLERIIAASSNPGDVVLDPFCGCGTAICAAQRLGRRWIGIDITHLAVSLMKSRLKSMFGLDPSYKAAPGLDPDKQYHVIGEPTDEAGARQLALDDRYQFQYWAVSLVEATAQDAERQQKKGADKGIDGTIAFIDGANRRRETIVVQVKSGHVTSAHIRDLKGVLEREKAAMGLYICLEPPTKDMREEASSAGFYHSALWPGRHGDHRWPRIQIRTIAELLAGQGFEISPRPVQFRQAERATPAPGVASPALWDAPAPPAAGAPIPVPVPDLPDDEDPDDDNELDDSGQEGDPDDTVGAGG